MTNPGERPSAPVPREGYAGASPSAYDTDSAPTLRQPVAPPPNSTGSTPPRQQPVAPSSAPRAPVTSPAQQQRGQAASKPRSVRRAKLRLIRLDPWSVTKVTFLLAIALGVMCAVAVFLIFSILNAAGVWDNVDSTIQSLIKQKRGAAFNIEDYVGMSRVMGVTMLIAALNVVLLTALATLGAFIYNMAAALLGGLEVTLAEDLP
ncbi:MAG: DUF3566 domain-containing protein [Nocardioidaceae bacterium]